jgi:hypothetical protein
MRSAKFKYDWGQDVRVIATAPAELHPGRLGSVCGMRELECHRLYLVEFADGETIEIQENSIEPVKND